MKIIPMRDLKNTVEVEKTALKSRVLFMLPRMVTGVLW